MFWNWGAIGKDADVPVCLSYANDSFQRRGLKVFLAPAEFTTIGGAPNGSVIVQVTCVPQSGGARIVVTAFSDDIYEEAALDSGAVDFVDKSRRLPILLKRLQLIAEGGRPSGEPEPARASALQLGRLTLRFDISRAVWAGQAVDLTLTEFKILTLLAEKAGQDVGYREIYDLVHGKNFIAGHGSEGYRANVRTFIKRIRKKFRDVDSRFDHIENYAGFGYRWTAEA